MSVKDMKIIAATFKGLGIIAGFGKISSVHSTPGGTVKKFEV